MPKHVGNPPIEESTGKAPAPSKPGPATGTSWAPRVGGWTRRRDPTQDQTLRDLHRLPKAHLHLHFTGSMRHETLLELAERDEVALPDSLVDQWPPRLSAADEKGWFRFQRLYDVARSVLRTEDDVRRLVREAADETGHGVGIFADLQGPKIRLETFAEGSARLEVGAEWTITTRDVPGDGEICGTTYKGLPGDVAPGDPDPRLALAY